MSTYRFLLLLAVCLPAAPLAAQPTWAGEIAPILYDHCLSCHRTGGVGNFPLETYTDAKQNAANILNAVETRNMPPWRAEPTYRHFRDENYLSNAEIQSITDWVLGGMPAGDLNQAPPLPNFQNGSQLTAVDMQLATPAYTIDKNTDIYRAFVIPTNVIKDKFFNEIEFFPGNDAIIHHIVIYTDPTDEPVKRDQADPGPGFTTNGMVGEVTPQANLIGEWTPGGTPIKMPPQFGYRIPANGYFIVEIHFAPNHMGQTDEGTIINLKLTENPPRELYYSALVAADTFFGLVNPPFLIPANTERKLIGELKITDISFTNISVFTLTPHAHVVCKSFKAYSYRPGFTDTIPLINIPKWDFYWQSTYVLQKPLRLNTNRRCRAEVVYDNTENNPNNPNFPPKDVKWGERTGDEMLYLFATIATYKAGDENIVLDSTLLTSTPVIVQDDRITAAPNPVNDVLEVRTENPLDGITDLKITDLNGRLCRQWRERNLSRSRISTTDLPTGVYILHIQHKNELRTYKLIKN